MGRHDRQARLAEIGSAGQERIAAATVEIETEGLAAEVAIRYLAGAGVGRLRVRDPLLAAAALAVDPALHALVDTGTTTIATAADEASFEFHDPSAREVARGAREALRALRDIIEGPR
jgi:molybdopterin/thiamine biosynthesis adenylyltransferase